MSEWAAIGWVATLTAAACSLAGALLVVRRMAMTADAISHAVLPGLVAAYALAFGPNLGWGIVGGIAAGLGTTAAIEALVRTGRLKDDSAIGIVFPAMFALGVVLITRFFSNVHLDADAVLFGEIVLAPFDTLVMGGRDLGPMGIWAGAALIVLNLAVSLSLWKEIKLTTFDPEHARLVGVRPRAIQYVIASLTAVTAVVAFSSVGAILVVALMIVPAAAAQLLTVRLGALMAVAVVLGMTGGWLGFSLARVGDVSVSGMIAVALGGLFALAYLFSPRAGLVAKLKRQRDQQRSFDVDVVVMHLAQHEGTAREEEEATLAHLAEILGTRRTAAETVVRRALDGRLVTQQQGSLRLTEAGRERARRLAAQIGA
ncbi:MAG: metal ABC transporter permease [Fimbriimonadaceae bacterium]